MGQVPGVSPLLFRGSASWRHLTMHPTCSSAGGSQDAAWACSTGVGRFIKSCRSVIRRESFCPAGCVVSAPLPFLSKSPLTRGRLPAGGGTFLRIRYSHISRSRPLALGPFLIFPESLKLLWLSKRKFCWEYSILAVTLEQLFLTSLYMIIFSVINRTFMSYVMCGWRYFSDFFRVYHMNSAMLTQSLKLRSVSVFKCLNSFFYTVQRKWEWFCFT